MQVRRRQATGARRWYSSVIRRRVRQRNFSKTGSMAKNRPIPAKQL